MRARFCRSGRMTTTWADHTVASAISHLQSSQETALPERNRTGRCATPRAPRPALLLRRANKAQINPRLHSLLDEGWGSHQIPYVIVVLCHRAAPTAARRTGSGDPGF